MTAIQKHQDEKAHKAAPAQPEATETAPEGVTTGG
jgi:hypothetical protein